MLRITTTDTPSEQIWDLQGRLTGPWIPELKATWERSRNARRGKECVVDLNGVTFIDERGEEMLLEIAKEGARFVAGGVYKKQVVDQLKKLCDALAGAEPGPRSPD